VGRLGEREREVGGWLGCRFVLKEERRPEGKEPRTTGVSAGRSEEPRGGTSRSVSQPGSHR
jgi:hypothetical protein